MYMPYKYVIIVRTQKKVEKRCCSFWLGTIIPYLYCIYIYIYIYMGGFRDSCNIYDHLYIFYRSNRSLTGLECTTYFTEQY